MALGGSGELHVQTWYADLGESRILFIATPGAARLSHALQQQSTPA